MTIDQLKRWLETDKFTAARAVLALYEKQTDPEKESDRTFESNDVGFNAVDANPLTKIARKLKARLRPGVTTKPTKEDFGYFKNFKEWAPGRVDWCLNGSEWYLLHKRIVKYADQLLKMNAPPKKKRKKT